MSTHSAVACLSYLDPELGTRFYVPSSMQGCVTTHAYEEHRDREKTRECPCVWEKEKERKKERESEPAQWEVVVQEMASVVGHVLDFSSRNHRQVSRWTKLVQNQTLTLHKKKTFFASGCKRPLLEIRKEGKWERKEGKKKNKVRTLHPLLNSAHPHMPHR